jgi:putative phosphoribosyl transferase
MSLTFADRVDAGRQLAAALRPLAGEDAVVLGLPRGGVPVAAEVAAGLGAPLDVIVVRKLGLPMQPEVAMGAIGEDGARLVDSDLIGRLGVTPEEVARVEAQERATLESRLAGFRARFPRLDLTGKLALVVDDGIATGATASVACVIARLHGARRVVVAAPVGSPHALERVRGADQVVCLLTPRDFAAVGSYYRDFGQTSESEVLDLLARHRGGLRAPTG